jgi:hypothetical protein
MFANDRTSNATLPITFSVVGSGTPVQQVLPGHPPTPGSEGATVRRFWATKERRCDDEPALEYGCVDWFLYDKQRSQ